MLFKIGDRVTVNLDKLGNRLPRNLQGMSEVPGTVVAKRGAVLHNVLLDVPKGEFVILTKLMPWRMDGR